MPQVFELEHVCTLPHVSAFARTQKLSACSCTSTGTFSGSSHAIYTTVVYWHAPCGLAHTCLIYFNLSQSFLKAGQLFFFDPLAVSILGYQGSSSVKKPSGEWRKPKIRRTRPGPIGPMAVLRRVFDVLICFWFWALHWYSESLNVFETFWNMFLCVQMCSDDFICI